MSFYSNKKYMHKALLAVSVALFAVPISAQAETLQHALDNALSAHPQVESAKAALLKAKHVRKEQYSGYFPELSVSLTGGRMFGDNATSRGLSVTRGEAYSGLIEGRVAARQPIFNGQQTKNRLDAARAEEGASKLALMDVRETLAYRTVHVYLELLRVEKGLSLLNAQKKSVADYLSRIRSMVDDGAADDAELQQAKDVSIILEDYINNYAGQLESLKAEYYELTGTVPDGALVEPHLPVFIPDQPLDEAIISAKKNHPLLRSAHFQTKASEHEVEVEKAAYWPTLDGELSYLKSDKDDLIGGEVVDARAVLLMNWGFETGGAQNARVRQRLYEYKEAQANATQIERQLERAVSQSYTEVDVAKRQLKNQQRRYDLNKKLLSTYEKQFEGARISMLQLMQADNQLLLTKLEAENARSRLLVARYGVLAALGRLQDHVVGQSVSAPKVAHVKAKQ